jgi:tetratricopeptide (TPR) repeat protein
MKILIVASAVLMVSAPLCFASGPDFGHFSDFQACYAKNLTPDQKISACKSVLLAGLLDRTGAVQTYQNLGAAYAEKQDYADALLAFNYAIKWDPKLWQAYHNRAIAELRTGDPLAAAQDMEHSASLNPDELRSLGSACWYRAQSGNGLAIALADCNQFLAADPNNANALDTRGLVNFRMENYQGAVADTNSALAASPKMVSSMYVRGMAKLRLGDAAGGDSDIDAAKAIDPKIADTYAGYGVKP